MKKSHLIGLIIFIYYHQKEIEINQRGGEINQEIDVATISSSSIRKQIEIGDHPMGKLGNHKYYLILQIILLKKIYISNHK